MGQQKCHVQAVTAHSTQHTRHKFHIIRLCARSLDDWTKVTTTTTMIKAIKRHASASTIFFYMKCAHGVFVCAWCTHSLSFSLSHLIRCAIITHTKIEKPFKTTENAFSYLLAHTLWHRSLPLQPIALHCLAVSFAFGK